METFIDAVIAESEDPGAGHLERAAKCLDLSEISELTRDDVGPKLAFQLKQILDRIERVNFSRISKNPNSPDPWVLKKEPRISIASRPNGEWLFSPATIAAMEDLFEQYGSLDPVKGITDTSKAIPLALLLRSKVPQSLQNQHFILEDWQWISLVVLIFVGLAFDRLITVFAQTVLIIRMRQWLAEVDQDLIRKSLRPFGLFAMAVLWRAGLGFLDLPQNIFEILVVAVRFIAVTSVVWGLYRLVDVASAALEIRSAKTRTKFDDLLVPLFRKSAKVFIATFGLVFIAETMDLPLGSLFAGLGIGGLAFAFAAQDTVANLFGSLTIILDRPFHVGDWIIMDSIEGTVEEVGFRSTRIRTFYDSLITVPNSKINTSAIDNMGERRYRRWKTLVSITYDTPPEKIEAFTEGIRELVRKHPYTRKDYFHVYLNQFGASSLDILLYIFFRVPDWATELRERHRMAVDILRLAERMGVELAFPTQTLYMKPGGETAPNTSLMSDTKLDAALEGGREDARSVVESILGTEGKVPPPV